MQRFASIACYPNNSVYTGELDRGARSPLLFDIAIEPLAAMIRSAEYLHLPNILSRESQLSKDVSCALVFISIPDNTYLYFQNIL